MTSWVANIQKSQMYSSLSTPHLAIAYPSILRKEMHAFAHADVTPYAPLNARKQRPAPPHAARPIRGEPNAERQEAGGKRTPRPLGHSPNSNTARMREPNGSTFLWQQPTRRFAPLPTAPIPRGFGYDPETFATVRASRLPP